MCRVFDRFIFIQNRSQEAFFDIFFKFFMIFFCYQLVTYIFYYSETDE